MAEVPVTVWRVGRNADSQYLLVLRADSERPLPMGRDRRTLAESPDHPNRSHPDDARGADGEGPAGQEQAPAQQVLPMVIGPCEAMAIWSVLHQEAEGRRPMTHDLLRDLIEELGGRVVKVVVDDLWNGVYYAKLHIAVNGEVVTVDARPSDAVAVALRTEAPLFATESVLTAAGEPEGRAEPGEADGGGEVGLEDL